MATYVLFTVHTDDTDTDDDDDKDDTLIFYSIESAPGIASDVATRRIALEWAPKDHRRRQRQWRTRPMISDLVSQRK